MYTNGDLQVNLEVKQAVLTQKQPNEVKLHIIQHLCKTFVHS